MRELRFQIDEFERLSARLRGPFDPLAPLRAHLYQQQPSAHVDLSAIGVMQRVFCLADARATVIEATMLPRVR